jgi:hypothetical protein
MSTDSRINLFIIPSLPERRKEKRTPPAPTPIRGAGGWSDELLYINDLAEISAGKSGKSFPPESVFSFRSLSASSQKNAAYILRTCAETFFSLPGSSRRPDGVLPSVRSVPRGSAPHHIFIRTILIYTILIINLKEKDYEKNVFSGNGRSAPLRRM